MSSYREQVSTERAKASQEGAKSSHPTEMSTFGATTLVSKFYQSAVAPKTATNGGPVDCARTIGVGRGQHNGGKKPMTAAVSPRSRSRPPIYLNEYHAS